MLIELKIKVKTVNLTPNKVLSLNFLLEGSSSLINLGRQWNGKVIRGINYF